MGWDLLEMCVLEKSVHLERVESLALSSEESVADGKQSASLFSIPKEKLRDRRELMLYKV